MSNTTPKVHVVLKKPRPIAAIISLATAIEAAMTASATTFPTPTPTMVQFLSDINALIAAESTARTRVKVGEELAMEDLEEEMSKATPEERIEIIEREGSTEGDMLAMRARVRARIKKKIEEDEKLAEPPKETPAVKPASTQGPPAERSNVVELSAWRRSKVVRWAAGPTIGFGIAAASWGVFVTATNQHLVADTPVRTDAATGASPGSWDLSDPFVMRYEGMSFCAVHDYSECLEWLDRAYAKDPAGEAAWPRPNIARKYADEALAAQRDH